MARTQSNRYRIRAVSALSAVLAAGARGSFSIGAAERTTSLNVVTSTTIAQDLVVALGGDAVTVATIMGPGVDPHLYRLSVGDLVTVGSADLVVVHGLTLEGDRGSIDRVAGEKHIPVVELGASVPAGSLLPMAGDADRPDPHVWLDLAMWKHVARALSEVLVQMIPSAEADLKGNLDRYSEALNDLDGELAGRMRAIPDESRSLVSAHAAFGYFGRVYEMTTHSVQPGDTAIPAVAADVANLAGLLEATGPRTVFAEASVPVGGILALVEASDLDGVPLEIGGLVCSDSLGAPGSISDTYTGMMRTNVETIVAGLTLQNPALA